MTIIKVFNDDSEVTANVRGGSIADFLILEQRKSESSNRLISEKSKF